MNQTSAVLDLSPPLPMWVEAFDELVEGHPEARRLELIDGYVVMQQNPTSVHERIVTSMGSRLALHMDGRGCQTYMGGMRVQRTASRDETDKPRPDILVHCGPVTRRTFVTDPVIVIEVLSPSTAAIDRGPKRAFYRSLASVQHIVIISQDEARIEIDHRDVDGWREETLSGPNDVVPLATVGFEIDLATVYFGTDLV
jgi:Uma2 family endonuclease